MLYLLLINVSLDLTVKPLCVKDQHITIDCIYKAYYTCLSDSKIKIVIKYTVGEAYLSVFQHKLAI